jgi:hypothetical protein
MSTDAKMETAKQDPKPSIPDGPARTPKKGDVELTEQELKHASGGFTFQKSEPPDPC